MGARCSRCSVASGRTCGPSPAGSSEHRTAGRGENLNRELASTSHQPVPRGGGPRTLLGVRTARGRGLRRTAAQRAARSWARCARATKTADQALLLSERAMFLATRLPFVIRLQARIGVQESISDTLARLGNVQTVDRGNARAAAAAHPELGPAHAGGGGQAARGRRTRTSPLSSSPYLDWLSERGSADGRNR